jgi:hypothetical protein
MRKEEYVPVRQLFPTPPTAQTTDNQLAEKGLSGAFRQKEYAYQLLEPQCDIPVGAALRLYGLFRLTVALVDYLSTLLPMCFAEQ